MVRQFLIKNANGDSYNLMNFNHFGYSPTGLGISMSNAYAQTGANFILTSQSLNMNQFNLNIQFGYKNRNAYTEFYNFMIFLSKGGLQLQYTTDVGTFLRDIKISTIPKEEINEYHVIDEQFVFDLLTPWYTWKNQNVQPYVNQQNDGLIFLKTGGTTEDQAFSAYAPYNTDLSTVLQKPVGYVLQEDYSIAQRNSYVVHNNSIYFDQQTFSPLEIVITATTAAITNPDWKIIVNGKTIQEDRFIGTVTLGSTLFVSSEPQNQVFEIIAEDGTITNEILSQDLTKSGFVSAPMGEFTISFSADTDLTGASLGFNLKEEYIIV
jgi:hypothetical protein